MGRVSGCSVLDCGCGLGFFSEFLASKGARVWGLDPDPAAGRVLARDRNFGFLVGDAQELPFRCGVFDRVLCTEVLEHVPDDGRAVSELARVARPGAILVITVPSTEGVFGSRRKRIAHDHDASLERHHRAGYTFEELHALLEAHGIRVTERRYSMILFSELVMGVTKLAFLAGGSRMRSQADILAVKDSLLFRIWKTLFPAVLALCRLEDALLSRRARGHMLIVKAVAGGTVP